MKATVTVEIAPGELVDKLTILDIKTARILDGDKLSNVVREQEALRDAFASLAGANAIGPLRDELHSVNEKLWSIEDEIRDCERRGDFGPTFVALARAVYRTNDMRAALKRSINVALGSQLIEEKSYAAYG